MTQATATQAPNKFSLTGYLGVNPKAYNCENDQTLTVISVGVNEPGREKAAWYNVVLWNRVGVTAAKYLKKGSKVTVEGEMRFKDWTNNNTGETGTILQLHVNDLFGLDMHLRDQP
ncbi:MAG: single-stranded DNA-binding protein [Waterburya sp.]